MSKLRRYTTRLIPTLVAVPLLALFAVCPVNAFSDMNDSAAQADIIKNLQKRVDSLELRFEKTEIERNEAKKTALDWYRGVFFGVTLELEPFSQMFSNCYQTGYKFKIKRNDGTFYTLSPIVEWGYISSSLSEGDILLSGGIQKSSRIADRVSYSTGAYLRSALLRLNGNWKLNAIGGGIDASINFWFTEKSTIGIGFTVRSLGILDGNSSWLPLRNSSYGMGATGALRLIYTQHFLKHGGRVRT